MLEQGAPWEEVLTHVGNRLNWTDERLHMSVLAVPADPSHDSLEVRVAASAVQVTSPEDSPHYFCRWGVV